MRVVGRMRRAIGRLGRYHRLPRVHSRHGGGPTARHTFAMAHWPRSAVVMEVKVTRGTPARTTVVPGPAGDAASLSTCTSPGRPPVRWRASVACLAEVAP
ncbi:MAG TPA: hypothetical protein VLH79_00425 [Chthonomonadales bacterium]|nr:hypothetical protein [Chthonomonadales bacterium]